MTTPPTPPANPTPTVSNMEFAEEVRQDRLNLWWRVVLFPAFLLFYIAFMRRGTNGDTIAVIALFFALGAFMSGRILKNGSYVIAAWTLNLSVLCAATYPALTGNTTALQTIPLLYPFIVVSTGLMLPPKHTFAMLGLTTIITYLVPLSIVGLTATFTPYTLMGTLLALLSALISAQVSGELMSVTGWALENYSRERRTSMDLFNNRQQLEKTLRRSQVLSEKLQEINGELETAKHFRGQFLANMSHELRTPLNAIIGFSETMLAYPMMYDDVKLPDAYRHDLQQINTSGEQLLTIINDILDLSKVDAGKLDVHPGRVALTNVIDTAMMTAAGLVSKKPIELRRNVPRHLPDVYADEARLRQVLVNLYSNAAKFTDEGYIEVSVAEKADEVHIRVRDTGEGIPPHALEAIFEEFTQTDETGRDPRAGAGLGLTISRRLLTLMNGRIWAESTYGAGATFTVVVPKYDPAQHAPTEIPANPLATEGQ
jgi:signal transduction histidine kinase